MKLSRLAKSLKAKIKTKTKTKIKEREPLPRLAKDKDKDQHRAPGARGYEVGLDPRPGRGTLTHVPTYLPTYLLATGDTTDRRHHRIL